MNDFFHILNSLQDSAQRKVLSTIINVEGSSYRKEGAMMMMMEDGTQTGLLSGGCFENDLAANAADVLNTNSSRTIVYDMKSKNDLIWGTGSGCNGTISVLLEKVDAQLEKHLNRVQNYLNQRMPILHVKRLSNYGTVLDYIFLTQKEDCFGEWNGEILPQLKNLFSEHKKETGYIENMKDRYFFQVFNPKPRLIIFGATQDVRPLVNLAAKNGFHTIINDWRPAFCSRTYFPDADEISLEFPSTFLRDFSFSPDDFVIIMTHNFQKDQEILQTAITKKIQYLGVLGPRKRTLRLLEGQDIPDFLHSPVGLPIGAEGPEEIAISILADLIKTLRKRNHNDFRNIPSSRSEQKNGVSKTFSSFG
ncbi:MULTISPECIES: XdhC family protein [unclassified Sutcliffiella]|uniref:XdhC family protein n=1 Tax=unclassified Sutcliffiella TaxID=2837532 RepID=UPI0030CAF19C